jgi:hypothetical protein
MKNTNKTITAQANENLNKAVDLTQQTADATLNTSVEVARLAESSLQGLYKVGYDLNASGLSVAKGYWDALSSIRNEWINLFAQTGEKAVETIGTVGKMEMPYQKEVAELGKDIVARAEKVVVSATEQAKKIVNEVAEKVEDIAENAKVKTDDAAAKTKKAVASAK